MQFTDKDYADAEAFRAVIYREALKRVHERDESVTAVVDPNPIEAYFLCVWDYPGAWYPYVGVPDRYKDREELIADIVRHTLAQRKPHR